MGLSEEQRREAHDVAELVCRQHMNELFERSLPRMIQAAFTAHRNDGKAHADQMAQHVLSCPIGRKVDRFLWIAVGIAFGAGVLSGGGLLELLSVLK